MNVPSDLRGLKADNTPQSEAVLAHIANLKAKLRVERQRTKAAMKLYYEWEVAEQAEYKQAIKLAEDKISELQADKGLLQERVNYLEARHASTLPEVRPLHLNPADSDTFLDAILRTSSPNERLVEHIKNHTKIVLKP